MGQNTFLDRIGSRFEKSRDQVAESKPERCKCGSDERWLPRGQSDWRCRVCTPPPSKALVAKSHSSAIVVVDEIEVTCCLPWCDVCGSHRGVERTWSDGTTTTQCQVCKAAMNEWPIVEREAIL